jgi:hypothetical protein
MQVTKHSSAAGDGQKIHQKYIQEFHDEIQRHLYIPDPEALDIVLATAVANFIDGDPVWLLLVGPSGGGKTELLNMFLDSGNCFGISKITKNTLLSGYTNVPPGQDLLFQMKDKLVVIKDLAPILEMGKDEQREIFSDFRDAYDGYVSKSWGTGQTKTWTGKFGLIAAATNAIDLRAKLFSELGERFIRVNLITDSKAQTDFAMARIGTEDQFRPELKKLGRAFLTHYQNASRTSSPVIPANVRDLISRLGVLTAKLRTPVIRNHAKQVEVLPNPEVGTRLSKQLTRLAQSSALLYESSIVNEKGDYRLALRVAIDSIPSRRLGLISHLLEGNSSASRISKLTSTPLSSVQYGLEDLQLLGLITKSRTGDGWEISDETKFELAGTGMSRFIHAKLPPP